MKRTVTISDVINEIAETLGESDGEFVEKIANMVLVPSFTYDGDSAFIQETDDEDE